MNLREQLLKENSKENALLIVNYIGNDEEKFAELVNLFLNTTYRVTQRAAWVMNLTAEKNIELLFPYLEVLVDLLLTSKEDAVTRNVVRLLQFVDLPEELLGKAFENCFNLVLNKDSAIAIKAFGIGVLYNICIKEPDLKREVIELIKMQLPGASSGLKNRCLNTLKKMENL
ncbi:MAG: hypothetical protein ACPG4Y_06410 [Chitinophagales bacterium]